jgi:hypothetical protein
MLAIGLNFKRSVYITHEYGAKHEEHALHNCNEIAAITYFIISFKDRVYQTCESTYR